MSNAEARVRSRIDEHLKKAEEDLAQKASDDRPALMTWEAYIARAQVEATMALVEAVLLLADRRS